MKTKIIAFIPCIALAAAAHAASLTLVGGGSEMDTADISGVYDQITIETGTDGYMGNSSSGLITVQRTTATTDFNPSADNSYINAYADYVFSGPVVLDCTATTAGNHVISTQVLNASTLTFQNGITVKNAANNTRLRFGGKIQDTIGNVILNAVSGSIINSDSNMTDSELILTSINFTVRNTDNPSGTVYLGKYTHIFYGSVLNLETNVRTRQLAPRSSVSNPANNLIGTVMMNGHTLTTGSIDFNPDSASQCGSLTVDMTGDSASIFISTGTIGFNANYPKEDFSLDFINVGVGDKIYFSNEIDDSTLSLLTINGLSGDDIIVTQELYDGKNYYSYSVNLIPEPASYAALIGAMALFMAYRRRSR